MDVPEARLNFGALDYSMFALMLVVSVAVGVWFGVCGRRKNTAVVDYLMGGKSMAIFPVGVSLVASHISGITLMGVPAEIYIHGVQYILVCFVAFTMALIIDFVYLPVFYDLQLTSTYEYLQLRFNRSTRLMASFLFTLQLVLFIPIVVYVPSLAFGQVSGVNLHVISPIVCIICIFYTMLGGLKAVVWTDFLQAFVMVGALAAVMIIGILRVGGVGRVWELNAASGRLDLDWNPNPFVRNTVWATVIGTTFTWLCNFGVNQGTMQKFLSLPTRLSTHKTIILFSVGICLMKFLSSYSGLLIYANYHDCDPLKTQTISRPDQLLPFFVMDTTGHIPGLPGLFIAGVFSAALSSMSSALNSLAGTLYEDFVSPCLSGKLTELQVNMVMKTIVGLVGAICVGLVFVVERLGAVLELGYSIGGITGGALLGLFTLGILFPFANAKGALAGSISSLLFMGWLVLGAQHAHVTGQIHDPWFPSSTDGCGFNVTLPAGPDEHGSVPVTTGEPLLLYRLSYLYFGMAGTLCVLAVGLPVSALTGGCRVRDSRLLSPFVRRLLRRNEHYPPEAANGATAAEKELLAMGARDSSLPAPLQATPKDRTQLS